MVDEDATAIRLPVLGELTYRELHAFEHGVFAGAIEASRPTAYRDGREKHYWRMGYLPSMAARYAVIGLAAIGLTTVL